MTIDENWAVAHTRVRTFFEQQGAHMTPDGLVCGNCRITLAPCEGRLAGWTISRTRVQIEGPEQEARTLYQRFYIHFISAGG